MTKRPLAGLVAAPWFLAVLLCFLAALVAACKRSDPSISAMIIAQFDARSSAPVNLGLVSPLSWDRVCVLGPQYGFDFGLWTRRIVAELMEDKFGRRLSLSAVGRLLAALEITPQKPLRRAYERDPVAIAKWKEQDYPKLKGPCQTAGRRHFLHR